MIQSTDFEKIFYLYTIENPKYLKSIKKGFYDSTEIETLGFITKSFFERFKETPTREQIKAIVKTKFPDKVKDNIIDLIYDTNLKDYDVKWLQETSESWIRWKNLDQSLIDTIEYVKTTKVTPDNVQDIVSKVKDLIVSRNSVNFDNNIGLNFFDVESHTQIKRQKIKSGHQFVDNYTGGGYDTKSLIVYAGEQNIGKSIWLANDAANFVQEGHNVAFITAEMADYKVAKRIGANLLNIRMDDYDSKSKDTNFMKQAIQNVGGGLITPGELYIKEYPTSQATVPDIESYLKDLEDTKGMKLKAIVIDYINILANYRNPNTENTYMKIKQIAEDLRAMAVRNDWLIITATQITRGGYDSSELTLSHIAESAGLSHTADMIYGIIQTSDQYRDRIYWLKILKIRDGNGKGSRKMYNILYEYMRLNETDTMITGDD
jgi:archaellum biogenesis ATPase FlaH